MKRLNTGLQVAVGIALGMLAGVLLFKEGKSRLLQPSRLVAHERVGKHQSEVLRGFDGVLREGGAAASTVRLMKNGKQRALGMIVREDGWILSKASELEGVDVECRLADGRKLSAEVEAIFERHDLALLKIEADELPLMAWRTGPVPLGTVLLASGSGKSGALAVGVASVEERSLTHRGKGFLGANLEPSRDGKGIRLAHVVPGYPADVAGLRIGDILVKYEGAKISGVAGFIAAVSAKSPGSKVRVIRRRGEVYKTVIIELGDRANFIGDFMQMVDETHAMGGRLSERRHDFPVVLQTDLILAPEQCGGPAIDLDGKVVGINIARGARVRSYVIPAHTLRSLLAAHFGD